MAPPSTIASSKSSGSTATANNSVPKSVWITLTVCLLSIVTFCICIFVIPVAAKKNPAKVIKPIPRNPAWKNPDAVKHDTAPVSTLVPTSQPAASSAGQSQ